MKYLTGLIAVLFMFVAGIVYYDISHPSIADASGGSGGAATIATIGAGTSAQLASALSDETGTGLACFATAPTLTGPVVLTGVSGSTGLTITSTTAGVAISGLGAGTSVGGDFTGGSTSAGGNFGTAGVLATGGSAGGNGIHAISSGAFAAGWLENTGSASSGGRALVLVSDTTSAQRATMLLMPLDANPSGATCAIGDIFMTSVGTLRACAATTPAWIAVSNMGTKATIAGAGTGIADAAVLVATNDFYSVTGNNSIVGVALPTGSIAQCMRIMAQVAPTLAALNTLLVYGSNSDNDTVNGGAADAAYAQAGGTSLTYCTTNGVAWTSH